MASALKGVIDESSTAAEPVKQARFILARIQQLNVLREKPRSTWDLGALNAEDHHALIRAANDAEGVAVVDGQVAKLKERITELKFQFGEQMKHAFQASMQSMFPSTDNVAASSGRINEERHVLNEEGLPFVDPLESLPDSPPQTPRWDTEQPPPPTGNVLGRVPGHIVPFDPSLQGDERKKWMNSVMDQLEEEERAEQAKLDEQQQQRQETNRSALKLRRGFLQSDAQRPKKHVRIAAPSDDSDESEPVSKAKKVLPGMDPEDVGVQEEAARIVELLGPEVIQGHPNAERIFAEMEASHPKVIQKPAPAPSSDASKPAIGETVLERSAEAETKRTPSVGTKRKPSAFKQRQQLQKQAQEQIPTAPTVSQGISAIERAGRVEDELGQERSKQGLPPRVPHARPTKAYAAKLAQRAVQTSEQKDDIDDEIVEKPGRRVRFGGEEVLNNDESEQPMDQDEEEEEDHHDESDELDLDDDYDADMWESEDESLWDSDDQYGAEDLEALKPTMQGHPNDEYWTEELAREYAEAKARLSLHPRMPQSAHDDHGDAQESYGIAPLSASVSDSHSHPSSQERPRVSRFKAARMMGESVPDPNGHYHYPSAEVPAAEVAGHELTHTLHESNVSQNSHGSQPIMVLPSLAPVRFPRPVSDQREGSGLGFDLDGESDEDDERLHALMRARLSMHDEEENGLGSTQPPPRASQRPPHVGHAK